jgi:hypothetical protein
MAASDKLIPLAKIIAKSLTGFPANSSAGYAMPSAKKASQFRNPYTEAVAFFAGIYAKELKIAGGDATWNQRTIDGRTIRSPYVPNRGLYGLTLGTLIATSEAEWNELQIAIGASFDIVYPFDVPGVTLTPAEVLAYNTFMGTFDNGIVDPAPLLAADSTPLGVFAQGAVFANAWNTLRVPYDLTTGVVTQFIAPITQPVSATKFYYRFTGIRRWFF